MYKSRFLFLLLILASQVLSYDQDRAGVYFGFRVENLEHQNPYVSFSGPYYAPENIAGYTDRTRSYYLPFGYAGYGRTGFSDFHTAALDLLIQGLIPLNGSNRPSWGKPQTSTGSIPLFMDYEDQISTLSSPGSHLELTYLEIDLLRLIFAGNMMLPGEFAGILYGVQGGIGQIGVSGSNVNEDRSASPIEPKAGTVLYIDAVDTYYGWNTGFTLFLGDISIFVSQQFDYHYFIKGPPKDYAKGGTRNLTELTVYPFDANSRRGKLGFRLSYRVNDMPFLNEFVEWTEEKISYQNKGLGFTLLFLL